MTAANESPGHDLVAKVRRKLTLAKLALLWERLWPALWPPAGIIGLFLGIALIDLLPHLPVWLHGLLLVGFAAAAGVFTWRGLARLSFPKATEARRRVEVESGLEHRPLTILDDRLASGRGDAGSESLWRVHLFRTASMLTRIKVGRPRPGLAGYDRMALRAAVALVLVIGVVSAGADATDRLNRALSPNLAQILAAPPAGLELWITPPEYTGVAPLFFTATPEGGATSPVAVPDGSLVLAQVHDGRGQPHLTLGEEVFEFAAVDERSWRTEVPAEATEETTLQLAIRQGRRELAAMVLNVIPDQPPSIDFARDPAGTQRAGLRLEYAASDDYGVEAVRARVTRPDGQATAQNSELELELPIATMAREIGGVSFHDLTAHPWAGLPVEIRLEARDAAGQVGSSEAVTLKLPERLFRHPVAREIIEQRKMLTLAPDIGAEVSDHLSAIASRPERFRNDFAVHLALTAASTRLLLDSATDTLAEIQSLLWDTALRVEDGGLSLAERQLRELQRRLQEALAGENPDAELERLLEELREAIDRFFRAAQENLRRQLEEGGLPEFQTLDENALMLEQRDIESLLDRAQELARMGSRDAARQLLSQLQELLENLRFQPMLGMMPGQQEAQRLLQDLENIGQGQQQLLDQTFRQSQQGGPPQDGGSADSAEQERLRRQLGEAMRRLGEIAGDIPGQLGRAERSMRGSRDSLASGQPGEAIGPQVEALDQLRQGTRAAAEALARELSGPGQFGDSPGQLGRFSPGRDPLGRPVEGNRGYDTGNVNLPDEADLQQAREILDELRRRSGQTTRPLTEREYILRLLRRF